MTEESLAGLSVNQLRARLEAVREEQRALTKKQQQEFETIRRKGARDWSALFAREERIMEALREAGVGRRAGHA